MATILNRMRMRTKEPCKPMTDQRRMWRTNGMVDLTCEPVMSAGMSATMVTKPIRMRRKKHSKPMMHEHTMWRTEVVVLESVMIGQYISHL